MFVSCGPIWDCEGSYLWIGEGDVVGIEDECKHVTRREVRCLTSAVDRTLGEMVEHPFDYFFTERNRTMSEVHSSISGPGVGIAWIFLLGSIGAFFAYAPKSQADVDWRPGLVLLNPMIGAISAIYLGYRMQAGWWVPILLAAVSACLAAIVLWGNEYRCASVWTWFIAFFNITSIYRIAFEKQAWLLWLLGVSAQIVVFVWLCIAVYLSYRETVATWLREVFFEFMRPRPRL